MEGPLPWAQLRNAIYHPSVFRKMIGRTGPGAENGDLVTVYDRDGKVFGTACFRVAVADWAADVFV